MQAIQRRVRASRGSTRTNFGPWTVRRCVAWRSPGAPRARESRRLPAAALLLPAVAAAACTTGGIPILAPGEAKLGATALVFVDTNGIPNGDLYEHYDLSRDNVTLGIRDLVVTDRDGNDLLREPGDATALFRLFAVRNQ